MALSKISPKIAKIEPFLNFKTLIINILKIAGSPFLSVKENRNICCGFLFFSMLKNYSLEVLRNKKTKAMSRLYITLVVLVTILPLKK
jgi:hypothetical protein